MPIESVEVITFVVIGNVAVVAPARTVTEAGTVTSLGTPAERLTVQPPVPAGELRVTVPVAPPPATTDPGLTETLARAFPFSVSDVLAAEVASAA